MSGPPKPPKLSGIDHRRHPRIDLLAQVQVTRESEVYIMSTTNISCGGIFIHGNPAECPDLKPGLQVEVVIFAAEDLGVEDVNLKARIVRVEVLPRGRIPPGFGLQFVSLDTTQTQRLQRLIEAAQS